MGELAEGIYESLRTAALERDIDAGELEPTFRTIDPGDAPDVLARHVADVVRRTVERLPDDQRLVRINEIIGLLERDQAPMASSVMSSEQLLALSVASSLRQVPIARPTTPLAAAALLTNARDEPTLGAELRAELSSADHVDLLCAFVKWHGLRVIEGPLLELRDRGIRLRVITTTYMGATEKRALDELVNRFGAEVKVSYETQSTRLHAKAWLFRRNSGFDTGFVGSSNLSRAALVDGLEWNVRISSVATPELVRKFSATFDAYWDDPAFTVYDPDRDGLTLLRALASENGSGARQFGINLSGLEVRPFPHQEQVLEALETEREVHGRHRNLVVAATGTGKTVMAALDYRRLAPDPTRRPTLLFVAHRKEILDQSVRTYREVLSDGNFGEKYVGGEVPSQWRHVFASVQSLSSRGIEQFASDHFDIVVIDEFHHAAANTYRRLLDHLQPSELLGLTATPERADGTDVRSFFDGRTAYELRLWDALSADLLVPFHYFGIADDVDLSTIEWKRGAYDVDGLDRLYTGNDARAAKVLRELNDKVTDVSTMRALGFCVSINHARYMARVFVEAGISARALSGESSAMERESALAELRSGIVNVVFAVDLFNEGLDIPQIDTVLLLRPTQSTTIFLQQLGRGLRRAPGKAVLTVLDFIGQHRKEFRFDVRYRALTGVGRKALERQIESGFPFLPSGSQIVLDRVSRSIVLDNVRSQLRLGRAQLAAEVRSYGDLTLAAYLAESGREINDVYRGVDMSWTRLRREAGLATESAGAQEDSLLRKVQAFRHVDDPERTAAYCRILASDCSPYEALDERDQRYARMLFFSIWPDRGGFDSYDAGLSFLRSHRAVCAELVELMTCAYDQSRLLAGSRMDAFTGVPLLSHARYRREEILAAIDFASMTRAARGHQMGVQWSESANVEVLLVNLHKSEADFSPTTMYRDYAITPDLFHWESQNTTRADSDAGQRYIRHRETGQRIVLLVRDRQKDDINETAPFLCLGDVSYVSHRGERPMAITWKLERPMPGAVFASASVVAR